MAVLNKLLVLNAGSSSLKFKLYELAGARSGGAKLQPIAAGLCERVADPAGGAVMRASAGHDNWRSGERVAEAMPDHGAALGLVSRFLANHLSRSYRGEVLGVGHRVVHGGAISQATLMDERARVALEDACRLAPLHNPPSLYCLDAARSLFQDTPHVAVFDTTFHQTLPPEAYTYALPAELCQQHGIRRYGFHGISYSYLTKQAAAWLGKPVEDTNLIICHLGAGSSMCAVAGGASVNTSMGLTPLEGLMMGTRCGDIDPAIVPFLASRGLPPSQVAELMNKRSGFLGMTGDVDVRAVEGRALAGDKACQLALAVYLRRIRKYLGAYLVDLGGKVDALVFSAGVGENGAMLRELACSGLEWAGIALDAAANEAAVRGRAGEVQAPHSRVKVFVLPTDEQLEIAQQTLAVVGVSRKQPAPSATA